MRSFDGIKYFYCKTSPVSRTNNGLYFFTFFRLRDRPRQYYLDTAIKNIHNNFQISFRVHECRNILHILTPSCQKAVERGKS